MNKSMHDELKDKMERFKSQLISIVRFSQEPSAIDVVIQLYPAAAHIISGCIPTTKNTYAGEGGRGCSWNIMHADVEHKKTMGLMEQGMFLFKTQVAERVTVLKGNAWACINEQKQKRVLAGNLLDIPSHADPKLHVLSNLLYVCGYLQ